MNIEHVQQENADLKNLLFEAYMHHLEKHDHGSSPSTPTPQLMAGFEMWKEYLRARQDPQHKEFLNEKHLI